VDELLFLQQNSLSVAEKLIGWHFYKKTEDRLVGGVIIETEAYNQIDAASHTYKGQTPRNEVMFGPSGRIYVYFTYGMHYCVNIVTGARGQGEGVLIRTLTPDKGIELIRKRRGDRSDLELTNGPAKICQALDITIKDNGNIIDQNKFILTPPTKEFIIATTTRIGIKKDTERLWRFVAKG
jgi:DNA-3-methyladenine glycosylase